LKRFYVNYHPWQHLRWPNMQLAETVGAAAEGARPVLGCHLPSSKPRGIGWRLPEGASKRAGDNFG
jgi:hypothetical protein